MLLSGTLQSANLLKKRPYGSFNIEKVFKAGFLEKILIATSDL